MNFYRHFTTTRDCIVSAGNYVNESKDKNNRAFPDLEGLIEPRNVKGASCFSFALLVNQILIKLFQK